MIIWLAFCVTVVNVNRLHVCICARYCVRTRQSLATRGWPKTALSRARVTICVCVCIGEFEFIPANHFRTFSTVSLLPLSSCIQGRNTVLSIKSKLSAYSGLLGEMKRKDCVNAPFVKKLNISRSTLAFTGMKRPGSAL